MKFPRYPIRKLGSTAAWVVIALSGLVVQFGPGTLKGMGWPAFLTFFALGLLWLAVVVLSSIDVVLFGRRGAQSALEADAQREWALVRLGCLGVAGVYLLMAAQPEACDMWRPLVYLLAPFLFVVHERWLMSSIWVLAAICFEILFATNPSFHPQPLASTFHVALLIVMSLGNRLVLGGYLQELRLRHRHALADDRKEISMAASRLRLDDLATRKGVAGENLGQLVARAAVYNVQSSTQFLLEGARSGAGFTSVVLLVPPQAALDATSSAWTLVASSSSEASIAAIGDRFSLGIISGLARTQDVYELQGLSDRRCPPYYLRPTPILSLTAFPVDNGREAVGWLIGDSSADSTIQDSAKNLLFATGREISRLLTQERALIRLEKHEYEQRQLTAASELLTSSLTLADVASRALDAAKLLVAVEISVFVEFQQAEGQHRVRAANISTEAEGAQRLQQACDGLLEQSFPHRGPGLVVTCAKNRHTIVPPSSHNELNTTLFDEKLRLPMLRSVAVLPLIQADQVIGTWVLASTKSSVFDENAVALLGLLSNHVAAAWQNGLLYAAMQAAATLDALTGLQNRRALQDYFARQLAQADRTSQPLALIIMDIDHFKKVNDTYGHLTGDQVLVRVAKSIQAVVRKIDCAARWGGEEFAVVLPGTDREGGRQFAERLRQEVERLQVVTPQGALRVTLSLGVAQYPLDGGQAAELLAKADEALYVCKSSGRNCVRTAGAAVVKTSQV